MPATAKTAPRQRTLSPAAIDRQRQLQVATIARARALGEDRNALLDKATRLLTVHWGSSDWAARAAILKTVDWLLRVALHNRQPSPKSAVRPRPIGRATQRRERGRHH